MIVRKEVHIAVSSIYWTEDRVKAVDFITPVEEYRLLSTWPSRFVYRTIPVNSKQELRDRSTKQLNTQSNIQRTSKTIKYPKRQSKNQQNNKMPKKAIKELTKQ
jgi:hypothetical protein